jgi:hypothetical protein
MPDAAAIERVVSKDIRRARCAHTWIAEEAPTLAPVELVRL